MLRDHVVVVRWPDGAEFRCYSVWLWEQTVAIDPATREGTVDPGRLPGPDHLVAVACDADGTLVLTWSDGTRSDVHPGWLRHVADGEHEPMAAIGPPVAWSASDFDEPPTFDGRTILDDDREFEAWLASVATLGIGRLRGGRADDDFLGELGRRIGPIRGSNFGGVFTVESVVDPDSTANTGLGLGQHTDLPTRETPPGVQLLHCVSNTVAGGTSQLTDGLTVIDELRRVHPDAYEALTTLEWVFANRAADGDHRWIGPIVDHGGPRSPVTIRAFYPVRLAPHMPLADQPRAYDALRVMSSVAHDPRFMISYELRPGDVIGFDNRRIFHGRDAFDPAAGTRRLRGCYIDHDDVYSRLRVLRRPQRSEVHP